MSDWRIKQGNGGNIYDDLIEKRRKDLLSDINEIRRYAFGCFSPNDNQARNNCRVFAFSAGKFWREMKFQGSGNKVSRK